MSVLVLPSAPVTRGFLSEWLAAHHGRQRRLSGTRRSVTGHRGAQICSLDKCRSWSIFGNDPDAIKVARIRLAETILSVATEGNTDVEDLKDRAIVELAQQVSHKR